MTDTDTRPAFTTKSHLDVQDASDSLFFSTHIAAAEHDGRAINFSISGLTLVVSIAAEPWTQVTVDLDPLLQEVTEDLVELVKIKAAQA